jgi:uncharacterized membrane protein
VLQRVMTGRAMFIHVGAMLATVMLANTWRRIWPAGRLLRDDGVRPVPPPGSRRSPHYERATMPHSRLPYSSLW